MGILGLSIQRTNGIPIVSKTWTDKLHTFSQTDSMLTAGFMSAITAFANSFEQNIDYIQLSPKNDPKSNGISAIVTHFSDVMMICFAEPYLFLDKVNLKLQWIYENIIEKKLHKLGGGNVFNLTAEEEMYIEDILFDKVARLLVEKHKNKILSVLEEVEKNFYQENIQGFSINSFDNTIIFSHRINEIYLQNILCNMGKGGQVSDWQIQYKPVWISDQLLLVSYTNSAVKIPVSSILKEATQEISGDFQLTEHHFDEVPLYYYIITDPDCSIGPIMEKLNTTLHPILADNKPG